MKNAGKLIIYKHIEHSFDLKAKKLDFMAGADEWKQLWNFSSEMMYEYKNNYMDYPKSDSGLTEWIFY